jgi:NAD(P)-dependent dehydrogenase (short-subunit alcohol dehydrogenase family)
MVSAERSECDVQMNRFDGKVAIVLGASDRDSMGGAIARRLASEGARVIVAARRLDRCRELASEIQGESKSCDIKSSEQIASLADYAIERFGNLDIAVNCVGEAVMGYIAETDEETLRHATELHYIGPFLFIKEMARRMEHGGSIVTLSSITATLTFPNHAAYMGAKAGTDHLVRIAACEYGPRGIKVNSVSPGFTESPMTRAFLQIEGVREAFEAEIPLGRLNTVEDVASTVAWLCSDEAYLTGQNLHPSGGNTLKRLPILELG